MFVNHKLALALTFRLMIDRQVAASRIWYETEEEIYKLEWDRWRRVCRLGVLDALSMSCH